MAKDDGTKSTRQNMMTRFTIINTNARSLCPKIESLADCMEEMDVKIAIITETWLRDGDKTDELKERLKLGNGMDMFVRNRRAGQNGVAYGGVAVMAKDSFTNLKSIDTPNPDGFEVLACAGPLKGHSRKLVVLACLPAAEPG